jgi:DNA-binding MurR/RpiR family transcriptional regulator
VTRFFPKIGYQNIKEARADFRQDIQFMVNSPLDRLHGENQQQVDRVDGIANVMAMDLTNIQNTLNSLSKDTVETFFTLIEDNNKTLYTLGTRKEFSLAYYFYIQVSHFRRRMVLLSTDSIVNQLADIQTGDILVIFDFRRYSRVHEKACRYVSEQGGKVVVFADSPIAPAVNLADCLFLINTQAPSIFDSYTAGMTLINTLMVQMVETYGNELKEKHAQVELLYRELDIFKFQKEFPLNGINGKGDEA